MNMSPEAVAARTKYFEEKKAKGRITPAGVTHEDIEIALRKHEGNIKAAAEFLGMAPSYLRVRIYASEKLLKIRKDIIDELVDETESQLAKLVRAGNPSAVFFVLRTLGKDRGYVEKATIEHELGPYAAKNAANMIEAMRKGMVNAPELPLPPPKMLVMKEEEIGEGEYRVEEEEVGRGELQSVG